MSSLTPDKQIYEQRYLRKVLQYYYNNLKTFKQIVEAI